jgi:hypothetical protein
MTNATLSKWRLLVCAIAALGAVAWSVGADASATASGVAVSRCQANRWCTVTSSSDVTQTAAQLAIGNVSAGTPLAVTQVDHGQGQLGGQILRGSLVGTCVWSQYLRDWSHPHGSASADCFEPGLDTSSFVAQDGTAIWTLCYPRCFGGMPMRFDRRCGSHGRTFCYSHDCQEYANFFPWTPDAHPEGPIRLTQRHVLDVRYLARYANRVNGHPYYMVRDTGVYHGTGNWVFVSGNACHVQLGPTGTYHDEPRHQ